ncbi:unnamed protein product [Clavelina lepadiformis]|uniref:Uncharacterized protein n=1 Tax=Clavelina lepadiformis TaxID=159417 RepID=A0ABP0FB15_CLALP
MENVWYELLRLAWSCLDSTYPKLIDVCSPSSQRLFLQCLVFTFFAHACFVSNLISIKSCACYNFPCNRTFNSYGIGCVKHSWFLHRSQNVYSMHLLQDNRKPP